MPHTVNGIGTKFYGHKNQYPDNSFVTTEWFVFLLFPIFPIRSKRVFKTETSYFWGTTTKKYLVYQKLPLDWQQVFLTYLKGFGALIATVFIVLISIAIISLISMWKNNSIELIYPPTQTLIKYIPTVDFKATQDVNYNVATLDASRTSYPCVYGCVVHVNKCDIKGIVDPATGAKIYYLPVQHDYYDIIIRPKNGDRYFCDEGYAINNGFTKVKQ
jgi:hypothetical protein